MFRFTVAIISNSWLCILGLGCIRDKPERTLQETMNDKDEDVKENTDWVEGFYNTALSCLKAWPFHRSVMRSFALAREDQKEQDCHELVQNAQTSSLVVIQSDSSNRALLLSE